MHLHLQSVLQLVGLDAHQQTHGDRAQRHEQAQNDGETWKPLLDHGLGRTPAHRLTLPRSVAGCIHGEILTQSSRLKQKQKEKKNVWICLRNADRLREQNSAPHTVTTPTPAHWARGSKRSLKLVLEQEEAAARTGFTPDTDGSDLMPAREEAFTNSSPCFLFRSNQRGCAISTASGPNCLAP